MAADNTKAVFAYQKGINTEMLERFGVSYSDVKNDLHDDNQFVRGALENGISAAEFARDVGYQSGFKSVDEKGVDYAAGYNRMKAAILQFASENKEWRRGNEGTLFLPYDGGVVTMLPAFKEDSLRWAFRAELREGAELTPTNLEISVEGTIRDQFDGWDIEATSDWVHKNVVVIDLDASAQADEEELASPSFYR